MWGLSRSWEKSPADWQQENRNLSPIATRLNFSQPRGLEEDSEFQMRPEPCQHLNSASPEYELNDACPDFCPTELWDVFFYTIKFIVTRYASVEN